MNIMDANYSVLMMALIATGKHRGNRRQEYFNAICISFKQGGMILEAYQRKQFKKELAQVAHDFNLEIKYL